MIIENELRLVLEYKPETGVFSWKDDRGGMKAGDTAGTVHRLGYRNITVSGKKYLAHRLAWFFVHGVNPPGDIDHINGDKTDNRLANLRLANRHQNQGNKGVSRRNTSGVKGVVWSKKSQKWQAQIGVDGKLRYLGQFFEKEHAAAAYRAAAEKFFGDFAFHVSRAE